MLDETDTKTSTSTADTPKPSPKRKQKITEDSHSCPAYERLKRLHRNIGRLSAIEEIISRDFLTAMPDGAYKSRQDQISYLKRRIHEDAVSKDARKDLEEAQDHLEAHPGKWDEWDRANLLGMVDHYKAENLLDHDLLEEAAQFGSNGRRVHRAVHASNDWDTGAKHLEKVIDHKRRVAEIRAKAYNCNSLYESLMIHYTPGITLKQVWTWFRYLEKEVKRMLPEIIAHQKALNPVVKLDGPYDKEGQMWLNRGILNLIGFDFDRGGIFETGFNPVEGGTPDDTRLVIKNVDPKNFLDSLKSALHEGGHGLYTQGLPQGKWIYQPVAEDLGTTMQESQALFVEMVLGRTPEFFQFMAPRLEGLFHTMRDPALTAQNLYRIKNNVVPGFNRKKADEVTYFLHVLLRLEIECDIIEGKLPVKDIPEYWNNWMEDAMGIRPKTHSEGCLQDVHWFVAKFGYFPAYTLGHMIAAQLFDKVNQDVPRLFTRIAAGDIKPITAWLNKNIHRYGSLKSPDDLIQEVTGTKLSPEFLISHFENRYLGD